MPVYKVEEAGRPTRVVKAISSSAAIAHVVSGRFTTTNLKSADDIVAVLDEGLSVETAGETRAEPETAPAPTPEPENDVVPNTIAADAQPEETVNADG